MIMKTRRLVEKLTPIFIKIGRVAFLLGAFLFLTACATDDFTGSEEAARQANGDKAITFGFDVPASTRAGGADAATALGNHFIVYGEKGETSNAKYNDGNLVFPNYTVHYTASTAYTTTSNTKDWEYVGVTPISTSYVKMYDGSTTTNVTADAQTIKYWDYGATTYTFTAVSANKEDIENGRVVIQKNTTGAENVYQKGYTITLAKTGSDPYTYPQVDKLYFADRKVISTSSNADRNQENAYGGNVKFTFRNLVSQIRAGIYETIPGYDISEIKFFITGDNEAKVSTTSAFGAICPNNKIDNYEGTITVTYYSDTEGNENQPKVTQSVAAATDLVLGTNLSTVSTSSLLGTTASNPTWETAGGSFTKVFPQINNTTNLKLKCNYTLWNSVTHETITVEGATAEVPAEYLKWKPNFKYTYIFKISKNTNGQTGTGTTPAGLYPITFDAVEVVAEDGQAEYITTVSEPSITTFGVKAGKYTYNKNEYEAGSDIYATIMDGSSVVDFTLGTNVNVYKATTTDAANFPITEASVAESLAEIAGSTKKVTTELMNTDASTCFTAAPIKEATVPGEDGVNKAVKALKLTGVKATTATTALVVEYVKTAATYNTTSESHTFADAEALAAWEASNYNLYTDAAGQNHATSANNTEVTYYKRTSVSNVGVYAYKVIHVVAAP